MQNLHVNLRQDTYFKPSATLMQGVLNSHLKQTPRSSLYAQLSKDMHLCHDVADSSLRGRQAC